MNESPAPAALADRTARLLHAWELERSARSEELRTYLEVLGDDELAAEPELGVLLLNALLFTHQDERARVLVERLQPVFAGRGNDRLHRRFVNFEGIVRMRLGRLDQADALLRRLEWMSNAAGDERTLAFALANLGVVSSMRLDAAPALAWYERARVLAARSHDSRTLGNIAHSVGMTYRELGLYADAQREFETSLRFQRSATETAISDQERAVLLLLMGQVETAEFLARRAHHQFSALGPGDRVADSLRVLAMVAAAQGDLDQAARRLEEAAVVIEGFDPLTEGEVHEETAVVAARRGYLDAARQAARRATSVYEGMGAPLRAERMRARVSSAGNVRLSE